MLTRQSETTCTVVRLKTALFHLRRDVGERFREIFRQSPPFFDERSSCLEVLDVIGVNLEVRNEVAHDIADAAVRFPDSNQNSVGDNLDSSCRQAKQVLSSTHHVSRRFSSLRRTSVCSWWICSMNGNMGWVSWVFKMFAARRFAWNNASTTRFYEFLGPAQKKACGSVRETVTGGNEITCTCTLNSGNESVV